MESSVDGRILSLYVTFVKYIIAALIRIMYKLQHQVAAGRDAIRCVQRPLPCRLLPQGATMPAPKRSAESIARRRAYTKAWIAAHPDRLPNYKKAYRAAHPERVAEQNRKHLRELAARRAGLPQWLGTPAPLKLLLNRLSHWSASETRSALHAEAIRDMMAEHDAWLESLEHEQHEDQITL